MRTVSSLCAFGAGLALAPAGLAVVREPLERPRPLSQTHLRRSDSSHKRAVMTSAVSPAYHSSSHSPHHLAAGLPYSFSSPLSQPSRPTSTRAQHSFNSKSSTGHARVGQKRSLTPRTSSTRDDIRRTSPVPSADGPGHAPETRSGTPVSTDATVPARSSWLRRLSSTMPVSRDLDSRASSRPTSAAFSTAVPFLPPASLPASDPGFPDQQSTSHNLPPNKLVKRSTSLHSANGSPFSSPGSRLPVPIFRRPATSHQRSAAWSSRPPTRDPSSNRASVDGLSQTTNDISFQHYFASRISGKGLDLPPRRNSTGIPNPIKRVYPDRRYTPCLISAKDSIRRIPVEVDDDPSDMESDVEADPAAASVAAAAASSMLSAAVTSPSESRTARRTFSLGDLFTNGSNTVRRRPSEIQPGKSQPSSRLLRKSKQRVVSAPHAAMGPVFGKANETDSERPSKRRDVTDPRAVQRSIYSSSSSNQPTETDASRELEARWSSPTPRSSLYDSDPTFSPETPTQAPASSPLDAARWKSSSHDAAVTPAARLSAARSDLPSTVGSDSEPSLGDVSTDYHSDVPYDSYPTRTTRSSFGKRGPHIETIFDESPPPLSSGRSTRLRDFLEDGPLSDRRTQYRHSTIEEESLISTPHRSIREKSVNSTPSARPPILGNVFASSPPTVHAMPDPDDIDWDTPDDSPAALSSLRIHQSTLPFRLGPALQPPDVMANESTPNRTNAGERARLYDWSEVQPSPNHAQTPPRPRTVHGKKDGESRGSRTSGRRGPSGMHARSHSVPIVPDVDGKRNNVVANKFGTWGIGSKAATEDWNEDFEFDDVYVSADEGSVLSADKRIDSGPVMFVPRSVQERQVNVVANINLLREWGILIEELKELRIRAAALDMLKGPYASAWTEVDAMIELADQETQEETLQPRPSPPSSPGFDPLAFEESLADVPMTSPPPESASDHFEPGLPIPPSPAPSAHVQEAQLPPTTRPRKDSEAVARSLIAAIQTYRAISDHPGSSTDGLHPKPSASSQPPPHKLHFDTAILRHIVPYVNGLKRSVKDALRETEGLYTSPHRRRDYSPPPSLSRFASADQTGSPSAGRRTKKERSKGEDESSTDEMNHRRMDGDDKEDM